MDTFLVVGAGFAGAVSARMLADAGHKVEIIDKRPHIGGNAYDQIDSYGVLIHPYGPHIFHTNSKRILEFLSRFTDWRFYEHRVLAEVGSVLYPIPINRTTLNKLYGLNLTETEAEAYLASVRVPMNAISTSEDAVLSSVGRDLCDKFFRGYTRKHWGLELAELSAGVAARIPTRTNDDDRYFSDTYQLMPAQGYSEMFRRMLEHHNITVNLETDFKTARTQLMDAQIIYTGPIDEYFDFRFGKLPYRSLHFEHTHIAEQGKLQDVGTINYPNNHAYTRTTEFKHLTGQQHTGTSIVREYPQAEGDPFYPIPRPENEALFKQYEALAQQETGTTFIGRLAQYRYYNMDQVVAAAIARTSALIELSS